MSNKRCIVIGSGVGGLVSAALLANKGYNVTVLEQSATYGGKIGELRLNDAYFDTGPSVCTDVAVIDSVYIRCGKNPRDYWQYEKLKEITRYFWPHDGAEYVMPSGTTQIERSLVHGLHERPKKVHAYMKKTLHAYRASAPYYIDTPLKARSLLRPRAVVATLRSMPLFIRNLHSRNRTYFMNTKTVQLFDRFASYNGSNPYRTPAITGFAGVPEIFEGTYRPIGGMRAIAEGLYTLCTDIGVEFEWNAKVTRIQHTNNTALAVCVGKRAYYCDQIIYDGDVARLYRLLGDAKRSQVVRSSERSTSAVVFYWHVKGVYKKFGLHNILFSADYKNEYQQLSRGEVPDDPTIYINITSKVEPTHATKQSENWFVMVNVPANTKDVAVLALKEKVKDKIETMLGGYITILDEDYLSPSRLDAKTGAWQGAIYGQATNSVATLLTRPKNAMTMPTNIRRVGGTVHPGGGIPLAIRSAIIATDTL